MSLYNMINGVNPATFLILPMLGKHPDEYPRFRDCFIGGLKNSKELDAFGIPKKETTDDSVISIYTRTGGGNREYYEEAIAELRSMPTYRDDHDDDFDETFATFVFSVPEKWEDDFKRVVSGDLQEVSEEYKQEVKRVFPKLSEQLDLVFSSQPIGKK